MSEPLQIIIGIGVLVAGFGYALGQYRQGKVKSKLDSINLFKEQIDALEGKVDAQEAEIAKLTEQVEGLQALIKEKDKKLEEVLAILQGRDPDTSTIMNMMREYIENGKPFIQKILTEVVPVVVKLDKFLNKQTF